MCLTFDDSAIVRSLQVITKNKPGAVVEVRLIPKRKRDGIAAGYFDNFELVPKLLKKYQGRYTAYMTINTVNPGLLARYCNRFEESPANTTTDKEITRLNWLFVDIDPVRPAGINSSDYELQAAAEVADKVEQFCMTEFELPVPLRAMSGNGYHLLFDIDWPVSEASTVQGFLKSLDAKFSNNVAKVDVTTYNPARITKLYGTPGGKGDGTEERPARLAVLYP